MTTDEMNEMVVGNLRLVYSIAERFRRRRGVRSSSRDDLIQAGTLGLVEAVKRFDGRVKLSTHATPWIRAMMVQWFIKSEFVVSPPPSIRADWSEETKELARRAYGRGRHSGHLDGHLLHDTRPTPNPGTAAHRRLHVRGSPEWFVRMAMSRSDVSRETVAGIAADHGITKEGLRLRWNKEVKKVRELLQDYEDVA